MSFSVLYSKPLLDPVPGRDKRIDSLEFNGRPPAQDDVVEGHEILIVD